MDFKNAGVMRNGKIYTENVNPVEVKFTALNKIVEKDGVEDKYYLGDNLEKWNYLKGAKDIKKSWNSP